MLRDMIELVKSIRKRYFDKPEQFDIDEFTEQRNHKPKSKLRLIAKYDFRSKIQAEDLRYLLTALSPINFDYELLLLGEGSFLLDAQDKSLGIRNSDNVKWLRVVNDKHQIMSSDICVYHSRDSKDSVFVKKCMACGVPIVKTDFKKQIKLLRDVKYRAEQGKAARERIEGETR